MSNYFLGFGLLATLTIQFIFGFLNIEMAESLTMLGGIATIFFGVWGGIRLIKS